MSGCDYPPPGGACFDSALGESRANLRPLKALIYSGTHFDGAANPGDKQMRIIMQ